MSFSSQVKEELIRLPLGKPCCMLSELSALTQTSGSLTMHGMGRMLVSYRMESAGLARRVFRLLRVRLGLTPKLHFVQQTRLGGRRICVLTLGDEDSLRLMQALHMMEEDEAGLMSFRRASPRHPMTRSCCRRAFLRAAFLGCGSMNNPDRSYHLEWAAQDERLLRELTRLMEKSELPVHTYERRGVSVLYLKGAQQIADMLALIGAHSAMLSFENIRLQKQMHGKAVRMTVCDDNNIDRAGAAAEAQIAALRRLMESPVAETLPPALREAARLRLENPGLSLAELGQLMDPPVGKSGVNHRMRRLMALARDTEISAPKQQE